MSRTQVLGLRRADARGSVRADAGESAEVPGARDHAANVVRSDLFAIAATRSRKSRATRALIAP